MAELPSSSSDTKRLLWIDVAKGIGILWVVYFHFFTNYVDADVHPDLPSPTSGHFISSVAGAHGWDSLGTSLETVGRMIWLAISEVGFHAVGLFLFLGGWSLAVTTYRKAEKGPIDWKTWYTQRFVRLYPMYWVAHLVFLAMPFAWLEPIDGRFWVSLTGLRWIRIEDNFVYGNAAWWYFSMLIQLYVLFPLLFVVMRWMGVRSFVLGGVLLGLAVRYGLLFQWQAHGFWILGGNALSRLPEFVLGMGAGMWFLRDRAQVEKVLLGWRGGLVGALLYANLPVVYQGGSSYVFADVYTGMACVLVTLGVSGWVSRCWGWGSRWIALAGTYSFGIYLTHQPVVTWIGQRIKWMPIFGFWGVTLLVLGCTAGFGIWLERWVNAGTERLLEWVGFGGKRASESGGQRAA